MVAADMFATGKVPKRGTLHLAGALTCYRPYRCADGYVTLGALEPKFWAEFCRGVGREDLLEHAFDPPGSDAHRAVGEIFAQRSREQWREFATEHDCCLEPVLDLDEALDSELVAAREMVVELEQPGADRAGAAARRAGQAEPHAGRPDSRPRPGPRRAHRRGARRRRLHRGGGRRAARVRSRRRTRGQHAGRVHGAMSTTANGMLKMSELAERSGVSAATIKHYLREGLLGSDDDVVRTSRNMAYYPVDFVERVRLIKRLQEERFMPLKRDPRADRLRSGPRRADDRARGPDPGAGDRGPRRPAGSRSRGYARPTRCPRTCSTGSRSSACSPRATRGYDADDVAIIEAISRFRAGGYEEAIGFTVYDTLRYREALEPLVEEEVGCCSTGSRGRSTPTARSRSSRRETEPLRELVGAMHSKLLLGELRRQRGLD